MRFRTIELQDMDVNAVAELTFIARQGSALYRKGRTIKSLKKWFQASREWHQFIMMTAEDEQSDKLLGWMFVNLELPEIGFISDWHPVIHPDLAQDEIAMGLITHAKTLVETHSRTRLEIWFNLKNKALKDMSSTYITWYEQSGFNLVEDEDVMTNNPTKLNVPSLTIPNGIELVSLRKVTNKDLKDVVLETLQDGEGGWLTDQTRSQQEIIFENWFDRTQPYDPHASLVLKKDKEILGFINVRVKDGIAEIGPLGIVASHQGQGLGKLLVAKSLIQLKEKQIQCAILEVSSKNKNAIGLYSGFGFKKQHQLLTYAWYPLL